MLFTSDLLFFVWYSFPLPIITIKMMNVFKTLYVRPGMCISVERAVELDAQRNMQSTFSADVYRQPVLTEGIVEPAPKRKFSEVVDDTQLGDDSGKIV